MESDDRHRRANDAMIVASSFFAFTILGVGAFQVIFAGELSVGPLLGIPAATGLLLGLISYLSVGKNREYEDVNLTDLFGELTHIDGHETPSVDLSVESSKLLLEPVLSSVQGTPPPLLVAGSVGQERVTPHMYTITPEAQAEIKKHVTYTLANLPPLPTRLPSIQGATATEIPSSDITSAYVALTPREVLEAKPLKEVISDLGDQGYIDALLYCLTLSKSGSPDIVLSARGPVRGLGARGLIQDDGTTGFTRSDVLKMLRKARGAVSANLQSDIQLSGEGRS